MTTIAAITSDHEMLEQMSRALGALISATQDAELNSDGTSIRAMALKRRRQSAALQARKVMRNYQQHKKAAAPGR